MPTVNVGVTNFEIPENAVRVLVTGYGPSPRHPQSPTWLAVAPLNNVILPLDIEPPSPDRMQIVPDVDHPNGFPSNDPQHVHISALLIPPTYDDAFDCVTGLHARPPIIPPTNPPSTKIAPPPENGYDFIFHIGLAGRGPFRIERLGHKTGYRMKDSSNLYAPIIEFLPETSALEQPSQAEMLDQMRMTSASMAVVGPVNTIDAAVDHPVRGFGKGYESFAEDLQTTIDVEHLVHAMKQQGVELYSSMDAGHCVSDYTYYCSMAESRRLSPRHDKGTQSKVLFMHCCPVGQPFGTEDVAEAIRKIILWVCRNDP
ncbi:hypothetical protein F5148DRAFT_711843 [Russula earlei]|uniref:Uncharacterized protein n=1 Tax=Russula earlei TaxID=71964 RepID=A0ACC0UFA0_9AGAM|nr:hypothetical protein F5148DRAFT_711843 [Russula earlei]